MFIRPTRHYGYTPVTKLPRRSLPAAAAESDARVKVTYRHRQQQSDMESESVIDTTVWKLQHHRAQAAEHRIDSSKMCSTQQS